MGPIQPILSFSCFRGRFREFRVMTSTPEESSTRNRSTSKESRLGKFNSVRREGKRKTTAGVLEGFAPGNRVRGEENAPFSAVHPKKKRERKTAVEYLETDRGLSK
jgi:hypothetical protein